MTPMSFTPVFICTGLFRPRCIGLVPYTGYLHSVQDLPSTVHCVVTHYLLRDPLVPKMFHKRLILGINSTAKCIV